MGACAMPFACSTSNNITHSVFAGFSAASGCSEISCSQSQMFDELEVIAPLSASSLSLDRPSDSSDSPRSSLTGRDAFI
ncbi:hypothetical protein CHARACLAT_031628 [Characodon lateralis]|uniref:Secreted protein n=1 Tax=Characodon lateralis TaxID=208331 RepID=A0ABU7F121_9TELE|nr:hypothetical protein [Characodon lateralis]